MLRERITVEDVAADATNAYEVTVHGDAAIASLEIHSPERSRWVYVEYANGGSSAGCPAHWASYVRITPETLEEVAVRDFFPDAYALLIDGWTVDAAINHTQGTCDIAVCTHPAHAES